MFGSSFKAEGIFEYSGSSSDHLDGDFITNEDSLVMMYRANQLSDWHLDNGFYVEKGGSDSDKVGAVMVYSLKKGEYALAVYNSQLPAETGKTNEAVPISKFIKSGFDFKTHYDEARSKFVINFEKNIFERAEICDATGKKLWERTVSGIENQISLDSGILTGNTYCLTLTTKTGKRISKKIIN